MAFSVITAEGKEEVYGADGDSYELNDSGMLVVQSRGDRTIYSPTGWHQIFERDVDQSDAGTIFFLPRN